MDYKIDKNHITTYIREKHIPHSPQQGILLCNRTIDIAIGYDGYLTIRNRDIHARVCRIYADGAYIRFRQKRLDFRGSKIVQVCRSTVNSKELSFLKPEMQKRVMKYVL